MIESLLMSLFLTIVFETIIGFICGIRGKYNFLVLALINAITNPVIVYIINVVLIFCKINVAVIVTLILEVIVFLVEGRMFKRFLDYNKMNKYLLAFIINALSFSIGTIINIIGG